MEEERRKQIVYQTRMQTLMLLEKHRRRRLEKESISASKCSGRRHRVYQTNSFLRCKTNARSNVSNTVVIHQIHC